MEIIKKCSLDNYLGTKVFKCDKCGCVFEADQTEYKIGSQYNESYYYIKCPTAGCGNTVYAGG